MGFYRNKPMIVEALQWTGENFDEIKCFCHDAYLDFDYQKSEISLFIAGLKERHIANDGDYIVKKETGGFYICEPNAFLKNYVQVKREG